MRRRLVASVLVLLGVASPVVAGEPTERLRTLFDEANRILLAPDGDTALEERVDAIRTLVHHVFDAREAAALALGRDWHARTPAERDEFVRLYADLVERAYLAWIGSRARVHGNGVRVTFDSEAVQGERASVVTTLQTRDGGEVPIEYHMGRRDGRWLVRDVAVDGLSLADSYRAQFHRVMQGGGYAELVERLHEKASPATLLALAREKRSRVAGAAAIAPVRVASAVASASDVPPVLTTPVAAPASMMPPPRPAIVVSTPAPSAPPLGAAETALAAPAVRTAPVPTAQPAAPPVAPAVAPPTRKWFWIQVGAFRTTEAASRLVERLRPHSVTVATGGQRSAPLSRVLVGPFGDRAAAVSTLRELAAGGYRAFIAVE
jgi:phospholipid transport system substrate-binding protein